MKNKIKILVFISIFCMTAMSYAQDYLGTYEALPPKAFEKSPEHLKAWEMSKLSIQILSDRIIFKVGTFPPNEDFIIKYTVEGHFILAKIGDEEFYVPIYVHDKNTVFANGVKLIRFTH